MATVMFRARCDRYTVSGAGTHVMPGHPMSVRTRTALANHGLTDPSHRSAEFDHLDARKASLVVAMAPEHVEWVRRVHPDMAARTATLKRLCRDLEPAANLGSALAALDLAAVDLAEWEEIVDPAGGDHPEFGACADEISVLIDEFIRRVP